MNNPALVLSTMLQHDEFTRWLGIVIDAHGPGSCTLHFVVRHEMLNGFGTIHGGVLFAASDSAFAFACNSHGRISVALDAQMSFIAPAREGDVLTVEAREIHAGNKTSFYTVTTTNAGGAILATFKGTAYRTSRSVY